MCGRYASIKAPADLADEFRAVDAIGGEAPGADYNVAPTKPVITVVERHPRDEEGTPDPSKTVRSLRVMRWGLVPSWAKDRSGAGPNDQCQGGDRGEQAGVPLGADPAPLPAARGRLVRVEAGGRREAAVLHHHAGRRVGGAGRAVGGVAAQAEKPRMPRAGGTSRRTARTGRRTPSR